MTDRNWRESLAMGDEVGVLRDFGRRLDIETVTHTTPTQVTVGDRRFTRATGRVIGGLGSRYDQPSLVEATPERRHTARVQQARRTLTATAWERVPEDVLLALYDLYPDGRAVRGRVDLPREPLQGVPGPGRAAPAGGSRAGLRAADRVRRPPRGAAPNRRRFCGE